MKIKKNQNILARREGNKFLLFNPINRQILFFSEYAFNIWDRLDNKKKLKRYLSDFDIGSEDLEDFLKELEDRELVYGQ